MSDWDEISVNQAKDQSNSAAPASVKSDTHENGQVVAKNNNKTMYLAMGGLMLFVMGVFGYTKYAQFLNAQQAEQQARLEHEKKQAKPQAEPEKTANPAKAEAPANITAESAGPDPAKAQAVNDDLAALAQLKNKNAPTPAAAMVASPANASPGSTNSTQTAAPLATRTTNLPATTNVVATSTPAQSVDAQKREQYISLLEGRVNDLGLSKLRLEAELCKYEPQRQFCANVAKTAPHEAPLKELTRVVSKPQPADQQARVMLFDTNKNSPQNSSATGRMSQGNSTAVAQLSPLQGLTILPDRILFRDRDGLTHEIEVGNELAGLGRLERIDFEKKSFQAGGRLYN